MPDERIDAPIPMPVNDQADYLEADDLAYEHTPAERPDGPAQLSRRPAAEDE